MTSYWDIIEPAVLNNLITNPSFETGTTGYATNGTNTIAQSTEQSRRGNYSTKCTYSNDNLAISRSIALSEVPHHFSFDVYIPSDYDATQVQLQVSGFTSATGTLIVDADLNLRDQWQRIHTIVTPDVGDPTGFLILRTINPTAGKFIYTDGWLICAADSECTYFDGDSDGCQWQGVAHASISESDGYDPGVGYVRNFADDLDYVINASPGAGMPPVNNLSSPLALQPGSLHDNQTIAERYLTLQGTLEGGSVSGWHTAKQKLVKVLNSKTVKINQKSLPRVLRVTSPAVHKEIRGVYDSGLEGGLPQGFTQTDIDLKFKCDNPLFHQIGESSAVITTFDQALMRLVAGRVDGVWDNLGPPSSGGTYTAIFAMIFDNAGNLYVGGNFLNFNGIAAADYIAMWNGTAWSAVGAGLNGIVQGLSLGPDGKIYITGQFTDAGGVAAADYIATWDGSAYAAVGNPSASASINAIYDMAWGHDGTLYVGGDFLNLAGVAASDRIAKWDGSAWTALSTGTNAAVYRLAIAPDDKLYITGIFTTAGGVTVDRVAVWDGTVWDNLGSGLGVTSGQAIFVDDDGLVYVGGVFTTAGGETVNNIAVWNGAAWSALGTGLNGGVYAIRRIGTLLYVGGSFSTAGDLELTDRLAIWNGSTWTHTDIDFPGTPTIYSIVERHDDIYVGFNFAGTDSMFAASNTISYSGTYPAYPILKVKNTGAINCTLQHLENHTTGARIFFDYELLPGETLTMDFRPGKQSFASSFFGSIGSANLSNSDIGQFYLLPSNGSGPRDNIITCFTSGAPQNTEAFMIWKNTFITED